MPTIHWPQLRLPDFGRFIARVKQINLRTRRTPLLAALGVVIAVALIISVGSSTAPARTPADTGGSGAGIALPVVADPAPPPDAVVEPVTGVTTPETKLGVAGPQKTKPAPKVTTNSKPVPAKPTLTANDKKAIENVKHWWDVFRLSFVDKNYKGTRLTKTQLRQPEIVVVKKASCKQPASNQLKIKSRTSITYCNGKIELVPRVFLKISELGQMTATASAFLYHAYANTPSKMRGGRSDDALLGCLQGSLTSAALQYQVITSDREYTYLDVVIRLRNGSEDLHEGYVGTIMQDGRWA